MKQFLIRLAIYIPIISFFYWIFVPGFFDPEPFPGPPVAQAISHITAYGLSYSFWIAIYEGCYRAARYARKPKPEAERRDIYTPDSWPDDLPSKHP